MSCFIDTSVLLAVLDVQDANHAEAKKMWLDLLASDEELVTSNYVIVETSAVIQNRMGMDALRVFHGDVIPAMDIEWVNEGIHKAAVGMLMASSRRRLSLTDCVSFIVMRQLDIRRVFTLDRHFKQHGFESIP